MKTPLLPLALSLLALGSVSMAQNTPVDWKILAAEFAQNAEAAQAKYQGTMITVTGPVSSIAAGDMTTDDPSVAVTISTPDGPGPDIKCLFENEDLQNRTEIFVPDDGSEAIIRQRDAAGNVISTTPMIQNGQQVVISGSFLGFQSGDIVLQHCRMAGGGR